MNNCGVLELVFLVLHLGHWCRLELIYVNPFLQSQQTITMNMKVFAVLIALALLGMATASYRNYGRRGYHMGSSYGYRRSYGGHRNYGYRSYRGYGRRYGHARYRSRYSGEYSSY